MFIIRREHGRLKKNEMVVKLAIDTLDSLKMKKMAADSKARGKKPGSTCGMTDY